MLFSYRTTPHSTTGVTPTELMFGRTLQTRFHKIYPNRAQVVEEKQMRQKEAHDKRCKERQFQLSDPVYVRNFSPRGVKWLPGEIAQITGPVSYKVSVDGSHLMWRRHLDHIRPRYNLDQTFSENPLYSLPFLRPTFESKRLVVRSRLELHRKTWRAAQQP